MGAKKYLSEVERLFGKSPVVDSGSITRLIRDKKKVKQYHKQLLRNLVQQGKIKRLIPGCYTKYDDPSLAVFCFTPAYLGLEDALSHHGLWEQETIPVIITTRKVRPGLRKFEGANYLVRRIDKKYYFGIEYYPVGEFYLPYSDKEKTFLDVLYFELKFSDGELREMAKGLDRKKLLSYLKNYPAWLRTRARKLIFAI